MATNVTAWPRKTRELHNHHFDSTVWIDFPVPTARRDDATYAKSGTTWTEQIVAQLVFGGQEDIDVGRLSPWLDLRVTPREAKLATLEAQQHRRLIKTHLPVDALVFSPAAKYIYVGRDGRDVVWSLYNHHVNATEDWHRLLNDAPRSGRAADRPAAGLDPPVFPRVARGRRSSLWSFWENVSSWWAIRHLPNLLLLHFAALKRDLPGQMRRVAAFLGITLDAESFDAAVRHSSFEYMKTHAEKCAPRGGRFLQGGPRTFIHKGTNRRWRDVLNADDCRRYGTAAKERLGRRCARWLAEGGSPDQETCSRPSSGTHPEQAERGR